jgi:cytochrome P450
MSTKVETCPDLDAVDLSDPQTFHRTDLDGYWRRLRRDFPVYRHAAGPSRPGFWVVSRHVDVLAAYKDAANLSSEQGNVLATLLAGGDPAAGRMCAVSDGERHRALRNIVLRAFSPRNMAVISTRVRLNTRRLIAEAVHGGECDFAAAVSERVPLTTICDLLGVPESDRAYLFTRITSALSSKSGGQTVEQARTARTDILLYFTELMERRRGVEADDVLSVLANGRIDGRPLTVNEVVLNAYSIILGGDETSRLTMNDAVFTLTRNPDQWRALREHRVPIESACGEVLRWATPAMHFGRTAVRATEIAGQLIEPGDIVTLWQSSANRDERVFTDPDVFDLSRKPNKHLSFGFGPHFCIGAHLAQVEIGAMLDTLRTLSRCFEISGPVPRYHSNFLSGFSSLPVRFTPDEAGLRSLDLD